MRNNVRHQSSDSAFNATTLIHVPPRATQSRIVSYSILVDFSVNVDGQERSWAVVAESLFAEVSFSHLLVSIDESSFSVRSLSSDSSQGLCILFCLQ